MPDSNDLKALQARVTDARAQITIAVRFACRNYNHGAPPEEVEDFTEDIIKLLLEDECRRMQTQDLSKVFQYVAATCRQSPRQPSVAKESSRRIAGR